MKVLLIHELGREHGGGAVTAMFRLHRALQKAGVESIVACRKRHIDAPDVIDLPRPGWTEDVLGKVSWRVGLNDVHCTSTFKIARFKPFLDADLINIHGWHTNYFNYLALPKLTRLKPTVGTMHDMWNLTGHCSQSYDCERWRSGCGRCPYPETFPPIGRDATALDWKLKNRTYKRSRITFVAPSRWLLDLSRQSMIGRLDLRQIPNPVDTTVYAPRNRREARAALGIPADKHVIMFVSVAAGAWGKGGDLLLDALRRLPDHVRLNSVLLILGAGGGELADSCGMHALQLGYIHEDQKKAAIYPAADVLVIPSRAENQPLVLIEAMSCGVPMVGFDVGGIGELIETGRTGYLARPENASDLAAGIEFVIADPARLRAMAESCRRLAVENHDVAVHARRYIDLFEDVIRQRRAIA